MVRNLKGGTGTKALARKHSTSNSGSAGNIRLPSCNAEQLAFVSKMFGNGMCEVFTNDNVRLLAHIRNKFRGRQKDKILSPPLLLFLLDFANGKPLATIATFFSFTTPTTSLLFITYRIFNSITSQTAFLTFTPQPTTTTN